MSDTTSTKPVQDSELLWGISAISREIERGRPATRQLLEHGALPARRLDGRWVAPRDRLRRAVGRE
jgi:hypothetical protein